MELRHSFQPHTDTVPPEAALPLRVEDPLQDAMDAEAGSSSEEEDGECNEMQSLMELQSGGPVEALGVHSETDLVFGAASSFVWVWDLVRPTPSHLSTFFCNVSCVPPVLPTGHSALQ